MYFRFPILLLLILGLSFGLVYISSRFQSEANAIPAGESEIAATPTGASDIAQAEAIGLSNIHESRLKAHVYFLADDLLEGRDTGTRGAELAAHYIANEFRSQSLQPAVSGESYFQPVLLFRRRVAASSELSVQVDGEWISLNYDTDFLVVRPQEAEVEGDLVFTGYGIQAPEYDYDDFAGLDVHGKVTVYMTGEPASEDDEYFGGTAPTKYSHGRTKRGSARSLGALASIGIPQQSLLNSTPWEAFKNYYRKATVSLSEEGRRNGFPAIFVHPHAADLLFSGTSEDFTSIQTRASEGTMRSFDMQKQVKFRIDVEAGTLEDRNVAAFLEGSDPQLKSEIIVFTAHYDHVGIGTAVEGDSVYNGAADNASGVAGLLTVAEAFSALPSPPRRSLLFLAVTAEEKGLLGSEYYVTNPLFPLSQTVANFNFDMIGLGDTTGVVVYGIERSSLGDLLKKAAERVGLEILPDELPEERIFYRSDHYSFARRGIPAIFPGSGISREGFSEFESYYHQPSDDVTLPFNFSYMKKHVQMVFLTALWAANADEAPSWTPGDEFENAGGE